MATENLTLQGESLPYEEQIDPAAHEQRMMQALEAHPEQVNDSMERDGELLTALESGMRTLNVRVVKAMLEAGAVPFSPRGDRNIVREFLMSEQAMEHPEQAQAIAELVRSAQAKINPLLLMMPPSRVVKQGEVYEGHILAALRAEKDKTVWNWERKRDHKAVGVIMAHPEEVNHLIHEEQGVVTPLLLAIQMNRPLIVRALLDLYAAPFSYRGDVDILEMAAASMQEEIDPQIVRAVREAQKRWDLVDCAILRKQVEELK